MIKEVLIAIVLSNIVVVIYCGIMALTIFMSINKLHKKIDQLKNADVPKSSRQLLEEAKEYARDTLMLSEEDPTFQIMVDTYITAYNKDR